MLVESASRLSDAQISEIVGRLASEFAPHSIYLFGSQVSGTPRADSDVDVLVVMDYASENRLALHRRGYRCLRGLGLPVELHFCKPATLERFGAVVGSFYRDVAQRGRIVYAA